MAALRASPLHFAGNVGRRTADALIFCKREGGGEFTRFSPAPGERTRLVLSGEFISLGPTSGGFWTRIDAPIEAQQVRFKALGISDEAWLDWRVRRRGYDDQFRGWDGLATGFLTAGVPSRPSPGRAPSQGPAHPARCVRVGALGFGMLLPFVLINHNERHQLPLIAVQSVALGACVQAFIDRRKQERAAP